MTYMRVCLVWPLEQADKDRDGPEDKAFTSPLQAVLHTSRMEGRFRMFIARTKASNRCVHREAGRLAKHSLLLYV